MNVVLTSEDMVLATEPVVRRAPLRVHVLDATADAAAWDRFVVSRPEATFFHLAGWREVVERVYGHRSFYLYAERDGRIEAVLPLARIRSRLFGDALVSTPFCVYGGAIGEPLACTALEEEACRLAEDLGVDYLELRHRERRHPGWPCRDDLYVTFRKAIHPDPERNLAAIPRKQRAMIRKGEKAGLRAVEEPDVERFFRVYSESVRNLGTPVFPKRWFRALKEVFGQACSVLTVYRGAEPVASVMSFHFRDEVLPYYGGGTRAARALKANDFMYWEVMRRACQRGARIFDYGRSKVGTGSYRFKKHWGFEPEPLRYEYHLVRARAVPDVNPLNPKYRMAAAVWRRLPLALTRLVGPMIARGLG